MSRDGRHAQAGMLSSDLTHSQLQWLHLDSRRLSKTMDFSSLVKPVDPSQQRFKPHKIRYIGLQSTLMASNRSSNRALQVKML